MGVDADGGGSEMGKARKLQLAMERAKIGVLGLLGAASLWGTNARAAPLVGPWPIANPTNVLVLGTPHLSEIGNLRQEWLTPMIDRLAAWNPQIITIEALSGPECYLLRNYERSWKGTANSYCRRVEAIAAVARRTLAMDMPDAEAAAEEAVARLNPSSTPAERRRMAALFAAAGNLGSAATQWLRLPLSERRAGDDVERELATALNDLSATRNENFWIAAALAARLGLERVYPTDDHLSDRVQVDAPPGMGAALRDIWSSSPRAPELLRAEAMQTGLDGGPAVLALYRYKNRADVGAAAVRWDMGRAFATPSEAEHGRRYVAWWEARNLRMVANIRAALGRQPGSRALLVVGDTHKPYFDAYLGMMHEIRLVPTSDVLR